MKKVLVIALAVILVVSAVCVLAACDNGEVYEGECHYENKWSTATPKPIYGVKVDVTVKNGIIKSVKLYTDEETGWDRTSEGWTENQNPGDLGHDKAEAAYTKWINDNIVGQTVETVKGWTATATEEGQSVGADTPKITGATQSTARIIVAVQNALSKIPAAE